MEPCEVIVPRLTPLVDEALEAADAAAVKRHLAHCADCRALEATERAGRRVVQAHAAELRGIAPASLRARVVPVRPSVLAFRPRRPVWRVVPLSAAAALVLAVVSVVAVGALAPRGTLLAAQLTLDHLKCLLIDPSDVAADKATLEAGWREDHGWVVEIPPGDPEQGLDLVGVRQCLFEGGTMAHILYRQAGRTYSLYILPGARQGAPVLEIMGYGTISWRGPDRTYALVTDGPADAAQDVAAYFKARVR